MRYYAVGQIFLLYFIGAKACCEPEEYSLSYTVKLSLHIPGGPRKGTTVTGTFTGDAVVNYWPGKSSVFMMTGDAETVYGDDNSKTTTNLEILGGFDYSRYIWYSVADTKDRVGAWCNMYELSDFEVGQSICVKKSYENVGADTFVAPPKDSVVYENVTVFENHKRCVPKIYNIVVKVPDKMEISVQIHASNFGWANKFPRLSEMLHPNYCELAEYDVDLEDSGEERPYGISSIIRTAIKAAGVKKRSAQMPQGIDKRFPMPPGSGRR